MSDKRTDYISWDEYFMGVAKLASMRSKDPSTQVGACIVDKDNYILSVGYNGLPIGCSDEEFPWARQGGMLDTKYAFVAHAELNAILNSKTGNLAAPAHDAVFIVNRDAGLAAHFLQRGRGGGKVIRRSGTQPAGPLAEVLQIRKVYVNHTFQPAKGFNGFITGGVPDEGQGRTPELQRIQDAWNERGSRDERQRMYTKIRQALQCV